MVAVGEVAVADPAKHVGERLPAGAAARLRERLARRGVDLPDRVPVRLERPHVVVDRDQSGRVAGVAGLRHVLDAARLDAELGRGEIPAARPGEPVVSLHRGTTPKRTAAACSTWSHAS